MNLSSSKIPLPHQRQSGGLLRKLQVGIFLLLAFILLPAFLFYRYSPPFRQIVGQVLPVGRLEQLKETIAGLDNKAQVLAEGFRKGKIQTSFHDQITSLKATQGNILTVATIESMESFERSDSLKLFGKLDLGTTKTSIRVPAHYQYTVNLDGKWLVETVERPDRGFICYVRSPQLEPMLPVAIDTAKADVKSEEGWARFNEADSMKSLLKEISPKLESKAHEQLKDLAREKARTGVAKFVQKWLLENRQWEEGKIEEIFVVFADEKTPEKYLEVENQAKENIGGPVILGPNEPPPVTAR